MTCTPNQTDSFPDYTIVTQKKYFMSLQWIDAVSLGLPTVLSLEETIYSKREGRNNETNEWRKLKYYGVCGVIPLGC